MYKATWLITFKGGLGEDARNAAERRLGHLVAGLPGLAHSRNRPALEGSVNGGDIVCHAVFVSEEAWLQSRASGAWQALEEFCRSAAVMRCDWAVYRRDKAASREPGVTGGIHRVLLLAVMPSATPGKVTRFESEMVAMPDYLPAILNWNFSRVVECGGERAWTHVWEQEFARPEDLFGPYMMHPIHFAHIDRWFDPQSHDWIVDPVLCSTYCEFATSALAFDTGRSA